MVGAALKFIDALAPILGQRFCGHRTLLMFQRQRLRSRCTLQSCCGFRLSLRVLGCSGYKLSAFYLKVVRQ
ncbi:MAG: hypothetical protein A2710_10800 [Burkholderiales bacterium RIFCSPHIGHO2_01_FULL_64_960]|nr:MAG: hypothetical protein A2710_10800 [Burkholderiales bacterium RIFCSPHIGHO2_01_FULL_64_960]